MFEFLKKHDPRKRFNSNEEKQKVTFEKRQPQSIAEHLRQQRLEFDIRREEILLGIQGKLDDPSFDLEGAKVYNEYREVASDDNDFQRLLQCVQIAEAYENTAENDYPRKLQLCNAFLSREPHNQRFKNKKLDALKTIFASTDEKLYNERLAICTQIIELDPNNSEYKKKCIKLKKLCEKEAKRRAKEQLELTKKQNKEKTALAIANDNIGGRTRHPALTGKYQSSLNDACIPLRQGKVTVRIHTHGLSIYPAYVNSLDIPYRSIMQITCKHEDSSLFGGIAGAALGALFGGIFGAVAGAAAGASLPDSTSLCITYQENYSPNLKTITILAPKEEEVKQFIANYQHEIEITIRTGRTPSVLRSNLIAIGKGTLKIVLSVALVFFLGIIVIGLVISSSKPSIPAMDVGTEIAAKPDVPDSTPAQPTPAETPSNSKNWNALNETQCSLKSSNGTLTLSKSAGNAAVLEIVSNAIHEGQGEINVIFDRSKPLPLMGTTDHNTMKINIDGTFLKKMRQGTTMKINLPSPSQNQDAKTLKFTLMGFSQACTWAK